MEIKTKRVPVAEVGPVRQQGKMQSLQKNQSQGGFLWGFVRLIVFGGLLAGCVSQPRQVYPPLPSAPKARAASLLPASAPAVVKPPWKSIKLEWLCPEIPLDGSITTAAIQSKCL